ncbi:MAG: Crp/Fnr family transcriptional regulator [Bacteroidales bacterium]
MISNNQQAISTGIIPYAEYLTTEQIGYIKSNSNIVKYSAKDVIFKQNTRTSHIMFVKSGLVKIYKEGKDQKNIIYKLLTPNHYLGNISVFGEDTFRYSASALNETEILFIDITIFKQILEQNGRYATLLLELLSHDNLYMFDKIMAQNQQQLPGKVAEILIYFVNTIFNSTEFEIPLSRTELAELAGTTKESLIRTLTEFKNDKIIDIDGKKIKVNSIDIITKLSKLG